MQTDILQIYATTIHPLTNDEKLRLATLILEEVTGKPSMIFSVAPPKRKGDITRFFGMWKDGGENDSDNDLIDADLARACANEAGDQPDAN